MEIFAAGNSTAFAVDYIGDGDYYQGEFYVLMLTSLLGMMVMAAARDLITIFVALETITIPTFILAGWRKHDSKSNEAAVKYFIIGVLLALFLIWLVLRLAWDFPFWMFAVGYCVAAVLLFVRPIQAVVLTPLFGARKPTRHELRIIDPLWRRLARMNDLTAERYMLRVLPLDELNAFACGGHLVIVTTFAIDELLDYRSRRPLMTFKTDHFAETGKQQTLTWPYKVDRDLRTHDASPGGVSNAWSAG